MMTRILAIASNTFKEAIRQKVFYVLVVFALVLTLFSLFLGELTLGENLKMIKDMGLAAMYLFGVLIAVFVGVSLIFKEVERKTIYTIVSKPVRRYEFVIGKYIGLCFTIFLELSAMTVFLFLLLATFKGGMDFYLIRAVVLIYVELCVIAAAAIMFSSYSSSLMSTLFSIAFVFVGHLTDDLILIVNERFESLLQSETSQLYAYFVKWIKHLINAIEIVNLDHFAISSRVVHGVPIAWQWIIHSVFYGVALIILLNALAIWLFNKKDLS